MKRMTVIQAETIIIMKPICNDAIVSLKGKVSAGFFETAFIYKFIGNVCVAPAGDFVHFNADPVYLKTC